MTIPKLVTTTLLTATAALILAHGVAAQALPLTVYPAIQDTAVKTGQRIRMQIQFRNGGDTPLYGAIKAVDYTVKDKEGTPTLLESPSDVKAKYSAAKWIKLESDSITVAPRDFVTVYFTVTVPPEVSSCGNYALVYFEPTLGNPAQKNQTSGSSSSITAKIGGLVNFQINNKQCTEQVQISRFELPSFLEYGPIKADFDLANLGDIDEAPKGSLTVTNALGKTVDQKAAPELRIFPEAVKQYTVALGSKWMVGQYTITLAATYGKTGEKIARTATVWVFPWRVAVVLVLALTILILLGRKLLKKVTKREALLESELEKEREEIEELKGQLKKRND